MGARDQGIGIPCRGTGTLVTSSEDSMHASNWLVTALLAFLFCGCASSQTSPTSEARQALAPTGKLRVAFLGTAPLHAVKDAASGELKGPAVDLGREMARR